MVRLSINIDHVATVRQARRGADPDPILAAALAELAGAHGITCHLREDRRHIQERDVKLLRQLVKSHLNLETGSNRTMVQEAIQLKPDMVTLVPEKRQELTTEGGLNVVNHLLEVEAMVKDLQSNDIPVSLFIDPDINQIKVSAKVGANYIEINTGSYANASDRMQERDELKKITDAALTANRLGLGVNAGHGLNYLNVREIAKVPYIEELNIGHAVISRAVLVGMERAVRDMLDLIK